jgi:colicin import membrane protein
LQAIREEWEATRRAAQAAADKLAAAMSEIQGIQQQVIIATMGRAGVREGGTIQCIRETLAETEVWEIDPERFGMLAGAAENAKESAITEIRRLLADAERKEAEAKAQQIESDHADALIENAAIDALRKLAAEAREQEEQRQAAEAERIRRERVNFELNGPDARDMLEILAAHYQVEQQTVLGWINRWVWAEVEIEA